MDQAINKLLKQPHKPLQAEGKKNEVQSQQDKRINEAIQADLNNIREKIRLQNEIFQNELRLKNQNEANKQQLTASLEGKRKQLEELNLKIGIETGPQIDLDMDQLETSFFHTKQTVTTTYVTEIHKDIRNVDDKAGMTEDAFKEKWGIDLTQAKIHINNPEIVMERLRRKFIHEYLVIDYLRKITDKAKRNQLERIKNHQYYSTDPLSPADQELYNREVIEKVNAREKDFLLFYSKVREWEMHKAGVDIYSKLEEKRASEEKSK